MARRQLLIGRADLLDGDNPLLRDPLRLANTLLSVMDHCLRSKNYVNVIGAGKQQNWQWLTMDAAI